ncbi:MAG: proliferating cell nuclear antigen (pcna) [Candidatus Methanofastidiosia archaeon]
MIEVSVTDSRTLKYIIESIAEIVDEAAFIFDNNSFRIEGADPSIISKVEVFLRDEFFEDFFVDDPMEFGVDMTSLDKIAKRILYNDVITLVSRDRENTLQVTLNGGIERKFDASLIELNNNLPKIDLAFPAMIEIETEVFRNCIKDLAVVGGFVTFDIDEDTITLSSVGELGNAIVTIDSKNEAIREMRAQKPCTARYNISYLMSFLKAGQISDHIRIYIGDKNYPLKLEFTLQEGNMVFFLAPMEY